MGTIEVTEKTCSKCGKTLPISSFYKNKIYKDGHYGVCKECFKEYNKSSFKTNDPMGSAVGGGVVV